MRIVTTLALVMTLAFILSLDAAPSAVAQAQADRDGYSQTYQFPENHPRYMTTVVVIRNENKMRPVFITGRGGGGSLEFDPENPDRAGGQFAIAAGRYSTSRADAQRMAATEWVLADPRPTIRLEVRSLSEWEKTDDNRFKVNLDGRIVVGEHSTTVQGPAQVRTHGAGRVQGHPAPDRLALTATFEVNGRDLGLGGDDAGELSLRFVGFGFVR